MCNVFSGHMIADKKNKDWGKVLFFSGVHHEKDRKNIFKKYGADIKLIAWESETPYSLDKFKFTHDCGFNLSKKEKTELMNLLQSWAKKQQVENY